MDKPKIIKPEEVKVPWSTEDLERIQDITANSRLLDNLINLLKQCEGGCAVFWGRWIDERCLRL